MAEKLYTIPVNDTFEMDCECPVCEMYRKLENDALEFTLGPSYMEEDIRAMTDKAGFCKDHVTKMYAKGNRLGMVLMYQTHTYELIKSLEKIKPESKGGFLKKADNSKLEEYHNSKNMFELKMIEARKELDKIPESKWYVYDRLDNSEYSGFIDDSKSISNLAKIFPSL